MNLIDMYSSKVNSPVTTLTSSLTSVAAGTIETVDIADANSLPAAPGIATIGVGPTAETIKYTDITGNTLTIERGFEGPTGNWTAGTPIGRFFTSYDYESLKGNIENLNSEINAPAYSTIATTKLAVTPFTTGTLDAPMKYKMEGVSVANSVVNNDFSDGTTGWNVYNSTSSITNNIATITATSDFAGIELLNGFPVKTSDKIFLYFKVQATTLVNSISLVQYKDSVQSSLFFQWLTEEDLQKEYKSIITADGNYDYKFGIQARHTGDVFEVDGNTGVYAINMTQFGISDFTESQMLDLVHAMQAGTDIQSAIVDIRTTGKNLFDEPKQESDFDSTPDATVSYNGEFLTVTGGTNFGRAISKELQLEPNTRYTFTFDGFKDSSAYGIVQLQDNKPISSVPLDSSRSVKTLFRTTDSTGIVNITYYATTTVAGSMYIYSTMVEKGNTFTAYEPYQENLLAPQIELKSLPNGVTDGLSNAVVDPADSNKLLRLDKAVHTKNVSDEYALVSGDITGMQTTASNVDYAKIPRSSLIGAKQFTDNQIGQVILGSNAKEIPISAFNDISQIGNYFVYSTLDVVGVIYAKGTSLATAQADLAGTVIQYQLAEPVVTELELDEMYSFENGVLYQNGIPASIDYTTATNQGAVLKEMGSTVERIDDEVVKKANETMISNSFHADPQKYYGNVKTIDDFQDASLWTIGDGGQTLDSSNVKIENFSLKLEADTSSADFIYSQKNGIDLNLSKLNNGEESNNLDYIVFVFYVSNVNAITDISDAIQVRFSGTTPYGTPYLYRDILKSEVSTGWNYIKIQKSEFLNSGTVDFDSINSMRVGWKCDAGFLGEYISFQLIQLVKKDPLEDYPNPFQVNGVRDFAINYGEWFVGEEFGKIVMKPIDGTYVITGNKKYDYSNDVEIYNTQELYNTSNRVQGLKLVKDSSSYIIVFISAGTIYLRETINGTNYDVTRAGFTASYGDIVSYKLSLSNGRASFIIENGNVSYELSKDVSLTGKYNLSYLEAVGGGVTKPLSLSITEISHAHHSDIAETAKSLTEQAYCIVKNSAQQSIPNTTSTKVVFDTVVEDTRGMVDLNTTSDGVIIRESGLYMFIFNGRFVAESNGYRRSQIEVAGNIQGYNIQSATATADTIVDTNCIVKCNKNAVIQVDLYQNSSVAVSLNTGANTPRLTVVKVGE